MKRRVCSYDMFGVPDPSFVLKDTVGEMYFYDAARVAHNMSRERQFVMRWRRWQRSLRQPWIYTEYRPL
jgi:hypothetical protein